MPELLFKGKEFVYNHHLTVPYRPLEMNPGKSVGKPSLNGNLIIHGDNLHALKALLPLYRARSIAFLSILHTTLAKRDGITTITLTVP